MLFALNKSKDMGRGRPVGGSASPNAAGGRARLTRTAGGWARLTPVGRGGGRWAAGPHAAAAEIQADPRSIIPLDEFGFTHSGVLELKVFGIAFDPPASAKLDLSQLGFFLNARRLGPRPPPAGCRDGGAPTGYPLRRAMAEFGSRRRAEEGEKVRGRQPPDGGFPVDPRGWVPRDGIWVPTQIWGQFKSPTGARFWP
ncbi:hypothetical protein ACP70R_028140 [Stipagrostis hirtigluma subsp. patula]